MKAREIVDEIIKGKFNAQECSMIWGAIMAKDEVIGGKLWTTEDLYHICEDMLPDESTTEEIKDAADSASCYIDECVLNDCTEQEWDVLYDAAREVCDED